MKKIISIIGITSSGKSDLAIFLARKFSGEIVSADSRQVYVGLDWCSGKVTKQEQKIVPHHLIDVAKIGERFTLFDFQKQAYEAIDKILEKNKLPILCGGTGLYSRSVVEGYNLAEGKEDSELRSMLQNKTLEELEKLCKEKGIEFSSEPTKRRLIRILEKQESGEKESEPRYEVLQIGIKFSREEIYERIKIRLEKRMPNMIKEIDELIKGGADVDFLKSLGLEAKLVTEYLQGEFESYDAFFEELYKQERHFAKRQNTWYNKEKNVVWLDAGDDLYKNAESKVKQFLAD